MVRGVRTKKELAALGVGARLRARIGVLLKKGVEVTAAAIQAAPAGSAAEKALLDPRLLAEVPNPALLADLSERHGARDFSLALVRAGGAAVIALQEELAAAAPLDEKPPGRGRRGGARKPASGRAPGGAPAGPTGLARPTRAPLPTRPTSPGQAKAAGVRAFAGVAPAERVSALRVLALAEAPPAQKGEIFLRALEDEAAEVRTEAARLLVGLGLSRDLAEDLARLDRGEPRERALAGVRVARRLPRAPELDVTVGFFSLLRALRADPDLAVKKAVLDALAAENRFVLDRPARVRELLRRILDLVLAHPAGLFPALRALGRSLAQGAPEPLWPLLQDHLAAATDRRARHFLLLLLADIAGAEEKRSFLAPLLAAEAARGGEDGMAPGERLDVTLLGSALLSMPRQGIPALADAFPRAGAPEKCGIFRILGDFLQLPPGRVTALERETIARLCLAGMAGDQEVVRRAVLETDVLADRGLPEGLRAELAAAVFDSLREAHYSDEVEKIEAEIGAAGLAAAVPLLSLLGADQPEKVRARAARVLGEIARREGARRGLSEAERRTLEEILRELQKATFGPPAVKGEAFVALGKAAGSTFCPKPFSSMAWRLLWDRRDEKGVGPQGLRALGWILSGEKLGAAEARAAASTFRERLLAQGPEFARDAAFVETDGEKVFDLGEEIAHYGEVVPACVEGLRRVALGLSTPRGLRDEIARFLLERWDSFLKSPEAFDPAALRALTGALKEIALDPKTAEPDRVRIVKALGRRLGQILVIEAVSEILEGTDRPGELARLASAVLFKILERRQAGGSFPEEEREPLLRALGRLAGRRHLFEESARFARLRETAVETLLEGVKAGVEGCAGSLLSLRESRNVPGPLRETIAKRLSRFLALTPTK